jgi:hypothetical protein
MKTCFVTRDEFLEALGTVNAKIATPRSTLRFETRYVILALDIETRARSLGVNVLRTRTDDGRYILTLKGFGSKTWEVS